MLRVETISKNYGSSRVLDRLSFQILSGEVFGLLGPNGAGKTTTINIICNLLNPDEGSVIIDDRPVSDQTKAMIGIVPQQNLLYRSLTCTETLTFFAQIYGLTGLDRQQQIKTCLEMVKLTPYANTLVSNLSGGWQRRLSLAIALVHRPQLLILDEPTTGLDIEARYEVWALIQQLQERGMTILLTTHLLEEAERLCQRIGILKTGKLVAEGRLEDLRSYVAAQEVLLLKTPQEEAAIARGQAFGFIPRRYGNDLAFWLPEPLQLAEILHKFEGIPIESMARQPVRLEHIYLELTQGSQSWLFETIPDPWDED